MAIALATLYSLPAAAVLTEFNIVAVEPFADGAAFGSTGAYERVRGTFKGELDPADARNKVIVNIDKAPRNAAGRVEYEADFFLLRPLEAARGNNKILYDVTNRGRIRMNDRFMDAPAAAQDPRTVADVGNGFLLRRGYTLAWIGWDQDAPRGSSLKMKPVIAVNNDGTPIVRTIRDEIALNTRARVVSGKDGTLALRLSYEASSLDQFLAKLTIRRREDGPREAVPASSWAFANTREIDLLPGDSPPKNGSIYEFHYPAKNPNVHGIGFAATRDFVSALRHDRRADPRHKNPAGPQINSAFAFGSSQGGRYLRDFVRLGFNQDEAKRKVFDGVLAHISGIGGIFLNHEFAQPTRTSTQHEDHTFPENEFPFSAAHMLDPITGKSGSLLRNDGFDPLWMETNTSTEYWQKGASLLATDPLGQRDIELPPNARVYQIAGTQHNGTAGMRSTPGPCANSRNPHSPNPALRALLVALDEWHGEGKPAPASNIPRIRDGMLIAVETLDFPAIPGVVIAQRANEIGVLTDWIKPALDRSKLYRTLVPRIDADGNEVAGIRLPEIAVPLGTHTGWNLYKAPYVEGELCDRDGTYIPFAATRAEREARKDPRPSLEERYGSHAAYVKKIEAAGNQLVAARLLLKEDAERLVERANSADIRKRFGP